MEGKRKDDYDPYDYLAFEEAERLKELDNEKGKVDLPLPREQQGEEVQDILVSSKSESGSPSNHGEQAPIKRKPGRPPKGK